MKLFCEISVSVLVNHLESLQFNFSQNESISVGSGVGDFCFLISEGLSIANTVVNFVYTDTFVKLRCQCKGD